MDCEKLGIAAAEEGRNVFKMSIFAIHIAYKIGLSERGKESGVERGGERDSF